MYRLLLGQTVGNRYEVLSLLGRGGMGAVYLARDTTLERHVALKAVTLDERADGADSVRARFRREARLAASIRHPNVVTVHDFFSDERLDLQFLVMEHLDGEDLGQRVQRGGALAPGEVLDLLTQAADGVAAGHRAGLVHRDIKPGNLFLSRRGNGRAHVHVLDFGIAKAIARPGTATHLTMFGHQPLSPGYASPEQWRGLQDVTPASDVFSLGMSAYYALTGSAAYSQEDLARLAGGKAVSRPTLPAACPVALSAVLLRALCPDPKARYADADALLADLSSTQAPQEPTRFAPGSPSSTSPGRRRTPVRGVARTPGVGFAIGAFITMALGAVVLQQTVAEETGSFTSDSAEWPAQDTSASDEALAPPRRDRVRGSSVRSNDPTNAPRSADAVRADRAPSPASIRELDAALLRHFPTSQNENESGSARVRYVVLPDGHAEPGSVEVLSATSLEYAAAAVAVVNEIRFTPGRSGGRVVRATKTSTFNWRPRRGSFDTRAGKQPGDGKRPVPSRSPEGVYDISSVEVKPTLMNGGDVSRALERNYPPLLRDAGIGGTVVLSFRVGEDGRVDAATISVISSENEQFSDAARKVVERMLFRPAVVNDRPVKSLVSIPITFQPRS